MKSTKRSVLYKNHDAVNSARADILATLDYICAENNLRYFCFAKLLVGAIHYNDFIPDGVNSPSDIGLLRDDYNKLIEILYKKAENYGLTIIDRYPSGAKTLTFTIGKNVDIVQEDLTLTEFVEITISAFDYLPNSEAERNLYLRKVSKLAKKYIKIVDLKPQVSDTPMSMRKVFFLFFDTIFYGQRNPKRTYNKLLKLVTKYKDTNYIARLIPSSSKLVKTEDIFPTKRIKINHTEINAPRVHNYWTVEIDEKLMEQTRTIQKIDLVILKEFDRVCREIGVGYFICGGTMLGYNRHDGFIPWDDDIDVGMLREDYNKFLKEGQNLLNKDFFVQTRKSDRKIPYLFTKIRLNGTEYITKYNELRDFHKGICLDIFPFDYVPNSLSERNRFKNKAIFWANVHHEVVNHQTERVIYDSKPKSFYEWWARVTNEIRRLIIHLIPLKLTQYLYVKKATKYNSKAKKLGLTTVASFVPTYTYADVDSMIPYQNIYFEDVKVMALKDMHSFLTMQYGNYMELPLLHQRVGHDLVSWHVDDYIAEKYNIYRN